MRSEFRVVTFSILSFLLFCLSLYTQASAMEYDMHISEATCTYNSGSVYDIVPSLELHISPIDDGCRVSIVNTAEGPTNLMVPFFGSLFTIDRTTLGGGAALDHGFGRFNFVTSVEDFDTIWTALETTRRFDKKIAKLYHELAGLFEMKEVSSYYIESKISMKDFVIDIKLPSPPREDLMPRHINSIHDADLSEDSIARMLNLSLEECMTQYVLEIRELTFHDFDRDGKDEAVVYGFSCFGGTGGPDVFLVLTVKDGAIKKVPIQRPDTKDHPDYYNGLRGKLQFEIEGGNLVEIYPIYNENDANCCPTGGDRKFYYIMKNGEFVLDKVTGIERTNESASYYLEEADQLHDDGEITEAHEVYLRAENLAKSTEEKVRVYGSLTVTFYELGEYGKSREYCEKLLELSPDNAWAKQWLKKVELKIK